MTEQKEAKRINVKSMFFMEGIPLPCFEAEDGQIYRGYFMMASVQNSQQPIQQLHFYTDNEYGTLLAKFEAQRRDVLKLGEKLAKKNPGLKKC